MIYAVVLCVLVGLFVVWFFFSQSRSRESDDPVWYPKIAKARIASIKCRICGCAVIDGDLIIWSEKTSGARTMPAHARCAVVIKDDCGCFHTAAGKEPPPGWQYSGHHLLLTEREWKTWEKGAGTFGWPDPCDGGTTK